MQQWKLVPMIGLAFVLSACGLGDKDDGALGFEARMDKAVKCMQVHAAAIQAGLGPVAVAEGGPDAQEIIDDMREAAKELPDDDAQLPETYTAVADALQGVSGKGIEAASALAESPDYSGKVTKIAAWHKANCQKEEEAQLAG